MIEYYKNGKKVNPDTVKSTIRSAYDTTRVRVGCDCSNSPSLAIQEHKQHVDINNILHRATNGQLNDYVEINELEFRDIAGFDYQTNLNEVKRFESLFNGLPADERKRFNNDPAQLADYLIDVGAEGLLKDAKDDGDLNKSVDAGGGVSATESASGNEPLGEASA